MAAQATSANTVAEFDPNKVELVWPPDDAPLAPRQRLIMVMDQLESRVEKLRNDALQIEQEKDNLLATLDTIKESEWMLELNDFDRDDIKHSIKRVTTRCLTVETVVNTFRDTQQEDSLHKVNQYIDSLVLGLKYDTKAAHIRCLSFMNACSFQPEYDHLGVSADRNFEDAILGCTLDDQKKVKKRLRGLLDYFIRMNIRENI